MEIIEVFSGGSSGTPKKIRRPTQSWISSLTLETQAFDLSPNDRYGVLGSSQHSLWAYAMFRSERTGSFCVGLKGAPRGQIHTINTLQLSVLYAVTPVLNLLCQYAVAKGQGIFSVKKIIVGGASWPDDLGQLCQRAFPTAEVFCFYGSAELGYVAYGSPLGPLKPFPSVQVRMDDEGQLWAHSSLTIYPEQWLASGDRMAWSDKVTASVLPNSFYLLGRIDRLINQAGIKIQPEPIENKLKFLLGSTELAILGLPDPLRGERLSLILGPQLKSRHAELRAIYTTLPQYLGAVLKGCKLVQLNHWPVMDNGKLSLEFLRRDVFSSLCLGSGQSDPL